MISRQMKDKTTVNGKGKNVSSYSVSLLELLAIQLALHALDDSMASGDDDEENCFEHSLD